ncbi:FAD-binding oxidoreductase [Bradyrhizobium sp. BRP22]|uniref:FAD-binding oxidoreductase n=1 Tax=Bradyrhizobium sp. BRP22 TaxID=2793821 RepID=UPI001CD2B786|nr:FAD-binding oxidoreductase [Bradyrhizobium sp. BRP22]MCA1457654.1 FAD-binding oxidoreductase [Bradyrhizobium sp. BRP22]
MSQEIVRQAEQAVHDLRAKMQGRVTARGDGGYENARKVWNCAVDHHPVAIAFCESAEDVQAAVRTARALNMPVSVRGRGHDATGRSVRPDALVIDLSRMDDIQIDDPIATVAGGATAAKVIAAASARNLMAVTGWNGVPGMTGLTTVGGYGPLIASHGLALDNLTGAELVLADGQRLTVDQNHPDLLWALQGGGGNFGVVTSMKIRLHPARQVLGGTILFSWDEAETVLTRCAKAIGSASNNLSVVTGVMSLPDGSPALFLAPAWTGEIPDGEIAMEVLKRCGNPMHVEIASMSYQDLIQSFDARVANEKHYALETRWIPALNPEAISALIAGGARRTSPFSTIILQHFRGLPTQIPPDGTAFGLRREHVLVEIIACWDPTDADNGSVHKRWARDLSQTLAPMSLPGGYPNLLGPHARDQIAHAYGDNIRRLQAVKRRFDPDSFFSATPLPV